MTDFILSSSDLNAIQNHDDYEVIWFGSYRYVPQELKQFTDFIIRYDTFEACYTYIRNSQTEGRFLLVLTDFCQYLEDFNNLPQIQSIYILKKSSDGIDYAKHHYSKLVHIFTEERLLIERIRQDILLTYRNDLPITISSVNEMRIEQTLINVNINTFLALWNQFFSYFLVHSPAMNMNQLKETMIEQCRREYRNNPIQLNSINEFERNISSENVLQWYTKDSFVYRLFNKAFRTRNLDLICRFQYFTILLHRKLEDLCNAQNGQRPSTVYRGQLIGKGEFEALRSNLGHLISINTFMSTSNQEDIARGFLAGAEMGVLFKIHIPKTHEHILYPFANISRFSSILHEEEILFFPANVFRIDSIDKETDSIWIIQLTLTNETIQYVEEIIRKTEKYLPLIDCIRVLILEKTDDYNLFNRYHEYLTNRKFSYIEVAKLSRSLDFLQLIYIAGDPQKSIGYYKQLFRKEGFLDQSKSIVLNVIIGNNYHRLGQYDDASIHYHIALSSVEDGNRLMGEIYQKMGDVYKETSDLQNALSSYQDAVRVITGHRAWDRKLSEIYRAIADLYRKENNQEDVMIYEEKANHIEEYNDKRVFLDDEIVAKIREHQPDIDRYRLVLNDAQKLYVDGMRLLRKLKISGALEKLLAAEKVFKEHLVFRDQVVHKLAKLYEHVAFIYLLSQDVFNALAMWRRAIDIRIAYNL